MLLAAATVSSGGGTANEGTETFTILNGSMDVGSPLTVNVAAGMAMGNYTLPAGTAGGTYTIQAVYNGTSNFLGAIDFSHVLTASGPLMTSTATSNTSASFSTSAQMVSLSATVTSSITVNEGTVTFTILSGTTTIGSAVTVDVMNGAASTSYMLPAGTAVDPYTIQAVYSDSGTGNFTTSNDATHTLTVNPATSAAAAENATATFNTSSQTVTLNASVTSAAGTVDGGTLTFTIMSGSTVVGTAIPVDVTDGSASVLYALPAGTAAGNYSIDASFGGTTNFFGSSDIAHQLLISPAATTSVATSATASFNSSTQTVSISATVTSTAGTVSGGTVTFTIFSGTTIIDTAIIGTAINVPVVNGMASGTYTLPAGTAAGNYTIEASYGGTNNFATSGDNSQQLMVTPAPTTSVAVSATTIFSGSNQNVMLSATITSSAGTVNEGMVTFTILSGMTVIGTAISEPVVAGMANGNYTLPAGTVGGTYTIQAAYGDVADFAASSDNSQLNLSPALVTVAASAAHGDVQLRNAERHRQKYRGNGRRGDGDVYHPQQHGLDRNAGRLPGDERLRSASLTACPREWPLAIARSRRSTAAPPASRRRRTPWPSTQPAYPRR